MIMTDTRMNTINNYSWYSSYRNMKSKFRQQYDDDIYYQMGINTILSMFNYDERIYRPELFELILRENGCCALIETKVSKYTPAFCNFVDGERYPDGEFKKAFCVLLDGTSRMIDDWLYNPEIAVFFNNHTRTPDLFIEKYAYLLTNCDTSLDCNMLFSRKKPVPIARDNKTKNQIDQIFKDLNTGEVKTILADTKITDLIDNGNNKLIDVLNLTEVESSRYIQYLSQLHDNLVSRMFFHMGLSMSDINKQAQVTEAELNKNKATSLAFLEQWRMPRQYGIDEIERKTGIKLSFGFSPIWRVEMENQLYSDREKNEDNSNTSSNENSASTTSNEDDSNTSSNENSASTPSNEEGDSE